MNTDATTSLEVIAHLDFEHVQPCEDGEHAQYHVPSDPARMLVRARCPGCGDADDAFICLSGWEDAGRRTMRCGGCGCESHRDEAWTILRFIGGAA